MDGEEVSDPGRLRPSLSWLLILWLMPMALGVWLAPSQSETRRVSPRVVPVNRPAQITFEADPVLYAAVSQDGKWLVYTSGRDGFADLWLRSADPSVVVLPKRLTFDPANESAPAFSPDGKFIAYVGTGHDAEGDIYLLDLEAKELSPQRLTGRETGDGAPCFSPDGRTIYFHRSRPGQNDRELVALDLQKGAKGEARKVQGVGGDGSFPAISTDGGKLAFVTFRDDPGGDIFVLDLSEGEAFPLTRGAERDLFPVWSPDGSFVYLTRFALDTDRDGAITIEDNAVVCRIRVGEKEPKAYPLTSSTTSSFQPMVSKSQLFFLSASGGVSNVWSLPQDGTIPNMDDASQQMDLARALSAQIPLDPYLALLGYHRVLERFPDQRPFAAKAGHEIGRLYLQLGFPEAARETFQLVSDAYSDVKPEAVLALIELALIRVLRDWKQTDAEAERRRILDRGLSGLAALAEEYSTLALIQARTRVARAELLIDLGGDPASLMKAIRLLDEVVQGYASEREQAAEAMVMRAGAYSRVERSEKVIPAYLKVIERYPEQEKWADQAVRRILDLATAGVSKAELQDQVMALRRAAEANRTDRPRLAMGALNRIGDLFFAGGEWSKAKQAYRQVLDTFPEDVTAPPIPSKGEEGVYWGGTTQRAAARLALAEILYREERFREALDLYETEIAARPYEDHIYRLARTGYIRKSIAAGEFLYRLGEVASARKIFKDLIREDGSIVEAHRGYIKCAATQSEIPPVLAGYRAQLGERPDDPVAMYATALCLTYLEDKGAMEEARSLLLRVIDLRGQNEYFHQTLGYVLEVLETAYGQKRNLELAVESYQKAYFLSEQRKDPANAANLLLNLGNTHYLLGQYANAFQYYTQRLESGMPFEREETEILFYQRLGASAFQVRDPNKPIEAFRKALELIDARIRPQRASEALDKINRYILDRIVTPALGRADLADGAKEIAREQSEINRGLAELTQLAAFPPPDPRWETYRGGIEALLSKQRTLNAAAVSIAKGSEQDPAEVRETLAFMVSRVQAALGFPERLIHLKGEMLDRLGLAYQEAGRWEEAREAFEAVLTLNTQFGLEQNLAANRRSAAYNTYRLAGERSGSGRERLLREAAEDFRQVIDLVRKHGVTKRERGSKGKALINLAFDVSVDEVSSSEAMYGFSAQQEQRLAEAFLSRILIELGELQPAWDAMKRQLDEYSAGKPVSNKDMYGVALLYHRAGQLAAAQRNWAEAFDSFRDSAEISLRMSNPVSAATNVTNMGHVLTHMPRGDPRRERFWRELITYDRKTTQLLERYPPVTGRPLLASYRNVMGVHIMNLAAAPLLPASFPPGRKAPLESTVRYVNALEEAAVHFSMGLEWFENQGKRWDDRKSRALKAALHLNLAKVSLELGEHERATEGLEAALGWSKRGFLPEFEWRALAGLGRLWEALEVLEAQSFLRAGCRAQEIVTAFAPLVAELVQANRTEEAFYLAERISELERVNRMAPLVTEGIAENEKRRYRDLYPRLERIQALREKLATAQGEEKAYLSKALNREQKLLASKTQKGTATSASTLARFGGTEAFQELLIILFGLAVHAEELAEAAVKAKDGEESASLVKEYRNLLERYHRAMQGVVALRPQGTPAGLMGFLAPEPVQAIDVMENLTEDGRLVRFFGAQQSGSPLIAFTLTPGKIEAVRLGSGQSLDVSTGGVLYLACEDLKGLPDGVEGTYALSATHLVRSIKNRKPFKRSLAVVAPGEKMVASPMPYPKAFDTRIIPADAKDQEILEALPGTHTLLLCGRTALTSSVPTREGGRPVSSLAMDLDQGRRFPLTKHSGRLSNVSLALIPMASVDEAYLIGHMFSLFGCPTVLLPRQPDKAASFVKPFLEAYASSSVAQAKRLAQSRLENEHRWIQLGYHGMTPQEASAFAEANFVRYVKQAMTAFNSKAHSEALALLENARMIALEVQAYRRHLPNIYRFSRESAYAAGKMEKALEYARALVDLLGKEQPDSQAHAEALLRLGLVQAKMEHYDIEGGAIPTLDRAVEILTNLEMGPEQLAALSDLGVVLENATEYDRALVKFEAAATLSKKLNQQEFLARQYTNIGRLYDLRLSQYARAKRSYDQALSIYRELHNNPATAQLLIDIGRCYRLLGDFKAADAHYLEALGLLEGAPDSARLKAKILMEQANNAWYQARYQEAFDHRAKAYQIARESQWTLGEVVALNTSGLIWWTLGDNAKALRELDDALALAGTLEARRDEVASTLNNIGVVYREMGRYQEAMEVFQKALVIDRELKSRWAIAYDLRNQGLTLIRMDLPQKAIPLLEEAAAEAHAIGDRLNEAKSLLGLGEAQLAADKRTEAATSFERALELSRSMAIRETQWRALYGLALLALKGGRKEDAKETLIQSAGVIEGMRADIKIDQLRDGFLANKMAVYETLVTLLVDMGRIAEAFNVAERSRARNFVDLLGNQRLNLYGAVDQELYDQQRTLRSRIQEHEALVAQAAGEEERTAYRKALERLKDKYRDLILQIQTRNPQLASLVSVDPLKASQVQALLEPGVVLLAYYVVPQEILCWVVKPEGVELFRTPLGRASLGQAILDYRRMIQNLEPLEVQSKALFKNLLSPVLPSLQGARYLGIIPHGFLHYLSFATLSDDQEYLIDRFALFYLPSASVLRYTMDRRGDEKNLRVLAVANPDLGAQALDLPFAEREVGAIRWNFPQVTILTRGRATESWVANHIGEFGVIHMASHGEFDPINPLFSAVKLAKDKVADGDLEAAEVFEFQINADLVILSACQTGLGKMTSGDEIIGLNRSFLYAGTHALISSLWLVSDVSTAMLIKQFYRQYVGENKADSLKGAILHTRNWYPHPGYWGAFILMGDYY